MTISNYRCPKCYVLMKIKRDTEGLLLIYEDGVELKCPKCGNEVYKYYEHEKLIFQNEKNTDNTNN